MVCSPWSWSQPKILSKGLGWWNHQHPKFGIQDDPSPKQHAHIFESFPSSCVCVFFFWVCTWVDKMIYSYFVTWSVLMPHTIRNLWWVASIFVYQMILSDLSQGQVLLSEINFCGLWVHTNPQKKIEIKPFFLWSFSGNLQILCIFPPIFQQGKPFPNKNVSESFFFPFVFFQHVISTNQPTL